MATESINSNGTGAGDTAEPARESSAASFFKKRLLRDAEKVKQNDIDELEQKVPKKLAGLAGLNLKDIGESMAWLTTMVDRVRTLFDMIRDKDYKISGKTKALVAAALLYFVLPTDIIPDFIPGIGYLDDALVLSTLWKLIGDEVEAYINSNRRIFPE